MQLLIARRVLLFLALLLAATAHAQQAPMDDYAGMLRYLTATRIDGQALSGASGVIGVNMAAGDFNQQANLRLFAVGPMVRLQVQAGQMQLDNIAPSPDSAIASIGDSAFSGVRGVFSINQASGSGNTEWNVVSAALATQGIREAGDALFATVFASEGETVSPAPPDASGRERHVAVESTALRGAAGVVQLNQVAGSANATANVLRLSVSPSQ